MEEILKFTDPALIVLIPVLYFLGTAIKKSGIKNKYIPLILGLSGIVLSGLYGLSGLLRGETFLAAWIFYAVTQGILSAGASVYFDQMKKQLSKEE